MRRLGTWICRHPWRVVGGWAAALVVCGLLAAVAGGAWTVDYATPGSDSESASDIVRARFPGRSAETIDVVWRTPTPALPPPAGVARLLSRALKLDGIAVASPPEISPDGRTARVALQLSAKSSYAVPGTTLDVLIARAKAANSADHVRVGLAGQAIESHNRHVRVIEGLGLGAAVVVLVLVFGSLFAAALPAATAGAGVGTAMAVITLAAALVAIPDWASSVAAMLGLGAGIDYSLLLLTRYRAELDAGSEVDDAVTTALEHAGSAVLVAAGTVVIALAGLFVCGVPYLDGLAIAAALAVGLVALAAVTLLPAITVLGGERLRSTVRRREKGDRKKSSRWSTWSAAVQRRPWRALLAGIAVVVLVALPVSGLRLGFPDASNDSPGSITRNAFELVQAGFGVGANGPLLLVADSGGDPGAAVRAAAGDARLQRAGPVRYDATRRSALQVAVPATGPQDPATSRLVRAVRRHSPTVLVGGATAATVDQADLITRRLPWFVAAVLGVQLLLLLAAFRAVPVALKAAVMNLLSVAAGYGAVAAAAQGGAFGEIFGITEPTPVPAFIPVMLFAVLCGLSMDYEVFLLSSVREERRRTGSTDRAVTAALTRTGPVITAAAAIMVAVFLAFALSDQIFLKLTGIGLAAAVLIDATVVRALLVPALMHLLGERNWWFPGSHGRLQPWAGSSRDASGQHTRAREHSPPG